MDATTFCEACYQEKEKSLEDYMTKSDSLVGTLRTKLNLSSQQEEILRELLDAALTDTYITLLYALDGETSLGNHAQEQFKLICEDGEVVSDCGQLEEAAYEAFYGED